MNEEDDAYAAAEAAIEKARLDEADVLDLAHSEFSALTRLPESVGEIASLRSVVLGYGAAHTQITDLTPLVQIQSLTHLNLSHVPVADLTPIGQMTNLTELSLDYTQISDITPLSKLTELRALNIRDTRVTDLQPLLTLRKLADDPVRLGLA